MDNHTTISDIFIIGGGIIGTGIAVDAAGRGLNVILCEQDDLASGTSSASSKLIHGGLRYLEQYDFKLVRKSLKEREILLQKAPHIITPLSFVLPCLPSLRPRWLLRIGLWLYDNLAKRHYLPASYAIKLAQHAYGKPLKPGLINGFVYSDCRVDDSRLVILNAIAAAELGAQIYTRQRVIATERQADHWIIKTRDANTAQETIYRARLLINVSGPWVNLCQQECIPNEIPLNIKLVKGSHIVIKQLYPGKQAYILMHSDKRIIFVIPYLDRYTLIGTTEIPFTSDPKQVKIDETEITYLCDIVNHYFQHSIKRSDILWDYSGVRTLQAQDKSNVSEISRNYDLQWDVASQQAPLLTIIGGKITTYRELAEHVVSQLKTYFPQQKPAWTSNVPLPGGDLPQCDLLAYIEKCQQQYPWLPSELCKRYVCTYGTRIHMLLNIADSLEKLGIHFGANLYEQEVLYLIQHEWAISAEDILWRRTKLGLELDKEAIGKLEQWLATYFNQ